jgi:thiamine-monophosphate kinase
MADELLARYLVPEPPVAFAPVIARFASAAMDISDGFVGDLEKLALASAVGFDVPLESIPLSPVLATCSPDATEIAVALTGGDDYQFLFTVPDGKVQHMLDEAAMHDVQVTRLTVANAKSGAVSITGRNGKPMNLVNTSWRHF